MKELIYAKLDYRRLSQANICSLKYTSKRKHLKTLQMDIRHRPTSTDTGHINLYESEGRAVICAGSSETNFLLPSP